MVFCIVLMMNIMSNNSIVLDSDGTAIVAVSEWQNQTENTKVAGVYAVLDQRSHLSIYWLF